MKVEEFISSLRNSAPSQEDLKRIGLQEKDSIEILRGYHPPKKNELSDTNSFIHTLVSGYDLSNIEVGMFTFVDELKELDGYLLFGLYEYDWVVQDIKDKVILVLEEGKNHILWNCADNEHLFFNSLLECSKTLTACLLNENLYEDNNFLTSRAKEIANIAGNEKKYLPFYKVFLGVI